MNHRKLIKVISLYELLIILVDNGLGHISRENVIFDDYITPKKLNPANALYISNKRGNVKYCQL